jgi:acetate kinase
VRVLVVNAGSSSLKLSLLDGPPACLCPSGCAPNGGVSSRVRPSGRARPGDGEDTVIASRELDAPRARVDPDELEDALRSPLRDADAVGHRIVHGGQRYRQATRVDGELRQALGALVDLAPLHQPKSLAALDAVSRAMPDVPAVACFDTAFHATLPPAAATYALPEEWRERWGLRRYGFHGLSHAWVARRAPQLLGGDAQALRIVSCHLGAGASLCAIAGGRSLDTTMGFTPLEGLVMATRAGSIDPGLLLWLAEDGKLSVDELADGLEHRSGLLGLAGSADMREVTRRADSGDERASLALDVYVQRLRGAIAAMAAALGGLDALVFTGGVGERSAAVRSRAARGLDFLGVAVDEQRNAAASADAEISADSARVRTLVLIAREDAEIARETRALLGGHGVRRA